MAKPSSFLKGLLKKYLVPTIAIAFVLVIAAVLVHPSQPSPEASSTLSEQVVIHPPDPYMLDEAVDQPNLEQANMVRVVDGDTLVAEVDGQQRKVRLIGIDAPESVHPDISRNTPEGTEASAFATALVAPGRVVWLQKDVSETDRYGRLLRYVWLDEPADAYSTEEVKAKMLNARIEESGHARAMTMPPDTAYSQVFEHMEGRMTF